VITDTHVIKPEHPIHDTRGKAIGYTMQYLDGTHPLCQIFTQAFRTRHGIEDQAVIDLIQGMRDTVQHIHDASILVVDMNELNFLVDASFEHVYFIDVDSYQTPHFKATALMMSVQDPKTPIGAFTTDSDWFSWACVTFQMLMGLHPYKGKYAAVKGLQKRMEAGVSVFHPDVRLPKVCPSFDLIPQHLRDWYKAVLQDGKRLAPPTDIEKAGIVATASVPIMSDALDIELVLSVGEKILSVSVNGDHTVVRSTDKIALYIHKQLLKQHRISRGNVAIHWNHLGEAFALKLQGRQAQVLALTGDVRGNLVPVVDQIMEHDGRVYLKSGDSILEVQTSGVHGQRFATNVVANVVPNASKLYPGCCIQNMLGSIFVNLFTASKVSHQIRIPELDDRRVIDAKFDGNVLMVVTEDGGDYQQEIFWFDDGFRSYEVGPVALPGNWGINFVHLGTGVNVSLTAADELMVFGNGNKPGKRIQDGVLGSDMQLFKKPGRLMFFRGEDIYSMKMR